MKNRRDIIIAPVQEPEFWAAATLLALFVSLHLFCVKNMDAPLCKGLPKEVKASFCPSDIGFSRFCTASASFDTQMSIDNN